jgi:hypothetical protein
VQIQDLERNDLAGATIGGRKFAVGDISTNLANSPTNYGFGTLTNGGSIIGYGYSWNWKPTPFHTSGAYFTGLNPNSTLTINAKWILESAPTQESKQLVVLAQPSPAYDPVALEIYKEAARMLPPGVPVGDNKSGDFWDSVLVFLGDAAGALGSVIPGMSSLGKVAENGLHKMAQNRNDNEAKAEAKKKAAKEKQPVEKAKGPKIKTPSPARKAANKK